MSVREATDNGVAIIGAGFVPIGGLSIVGAGIHAGNEGGKSGAGE